MKKYWAELLGTYILVFVGTGAIMINEITGGTLSHLGVGLSFGLVVMAMIYAIGDISGAHINPAVTIAFAVAKRFPKNQILPYISVSRGNFGISKFIFYFSRGKYYG